MTASDQIQRDVAAILGAAPATRVKARRGGWWPFAAAGVAMAGAIALALTVNPARYDAKAPVPAATARDRSWDPQEPIRIAIAPQPTTSPAARTDARAIATAPPPAHRSRKPRSVATSIAPGRPPAAPPFELPLSPDAVSPKEVATTGLALVEARAPTRDTERRLPQAPTEEPAGQPEASKAQPEKSVPRRAIDAIRQLRRQ